MSNISKKIRLYMLLFKYRLKYLFEKPEKKYKVILKADDLIDCSKNVKKLDKILKSENIKVSWGIIGFSLEFPKKKYLKFLQKSVNDKHYHFFNHGYNHIFDEEKDIYEFYEPYEKQYESLKKTQELAKNKLGLLIDTFGAPNEEVNVDTIKALEKFDELKYVYFSLPDLQHSKIVLNRPVTPYGSVIFEKDVGEVDYDFFSKNWDDIEKTDVIVLQMHPYMWNNLRFLHFKVCVAFMKSKGVEFITPDDLIMRN